MTFPVITALTTGLIAILMMGLLLRTGFGRMKYSQGIGDGGNEDLHRRIRAHANLTENAPIFLIILALLEMSETSSSLIMGFGAIFIALRLSHAIALSLNSGPTAARGMGAMGSTILTMGMAIYLLWITAPLI